MKNNKILLLLVILTIIGAWFYFDLGQYLTLEAAKREQLTLQDYIIDNPITAYISFFSLYILVTALSIPGASILTLLGAALFGFWTSLIMVSFASTIGATLAFLSSRFILRDWVQSKFGNRLTTLNNGIKKEGGFYLLSLRLIPVFPFFLINLLMGLTIIKTRTFFFVSQLGMLAGTAVYINAGTQLGKIDSLSGIISAPVLFSLVLLGLFPLLTKWIMKTMAMKKQYQQWQKPARFDQNLVVIGAGSGGLVSAYIAAAVKAEVTLIERHKMGGDCLNTGCVPSKALIRAAHTAADIKNASTLGIDAQINHIDFAQVMGRIHNVIAKIEPHDSIERYSQLGVNCVTGDATILSPWEVEVNGTRITTRNIVIATGARPLVPAIPGLDTVNYLTSDTVWQLTALPKRLLILGGGPIGCELAQSFCRLGAEVTIVERSPQLLNREDRDAAQLVEQSLAHDGVNILLQHNAVQFESTLDDNGQRIQRVVVEHDNQQVSIEFDAVMVALGRVANVQGFGLEELGITTTERGTVAVNQYLQTQYPNIYAVGDVAGPYQLTHVAAHQAWYAAVNSLFGAVKKFKVDYSVIPAVTYTAPELARVGINEKEAQAQGIDYEVTRYGLDDLDRAIADGYDEGFIKILTPKGSDKILGATIVGHHAGDLLAEFTLAMRHNLGLNKILGTIHPYPTMSEGAKYTAGVWKKAHAPQKLLAWVKKYHQWMRS
ncbi:FAD-dependent oxidoreductase [Photobacterium iliopiscarium]|jgi:dihydrolipoamide dehydrogenase|uniref:Pyridine nucleotide-disulfide oxidoreductase n=1 Tax=Photobacterium iliopiscarium TaxID=56192 RepID=A0A2T3MN33_9GAMM|nr:FAD-dependent oxidoreductase [Photobacterium iliopiscarium]KJG13092.1 pyridine nucleotide-disulfide oxidoreductase [Photobacterium iliopiscarium]MCD9466488.1 pyridine nucleotide-disulfide oxidoreductase [Photobacterium iliopiscarium]MCD9486146.1 pyridine nucleotide-disulfide oxidoreductase [Photobacterium iliopiscarium]MCF2243809.1 pyridine nucleotide-disulfide oxidoreductase [Photobacterium iliopiscarium]PST91450.1 pyridine nucleotide-disulfide oxidoreductase [Photobacterium iliopiscarium]